VDKRVVIYCSSGGIERIKTALKAKLDLATVEYFAKLSSEKRMAAISDFNFKKTKVLLATELASRGFSFLPPIDCIISFDACEKAEEELVRMCRSNKGEAECTADLI
jgi:superfamily II DNA/RNA helicase